uniref:Calcium channel, voltage-dependent, alpha 2/delta subunit 4b n=1 Tax=Echeneis naucrates TaxID=173247 RepID=A0A665TIA5_ECHNA
MCFNIQPVFHIINRYRDLQPACQSSFIFEAVIKLSFVSLQKLKDVDSVIKIVELDGGDLVKDYSDEIERMLGSKMKNLVLSSSQFDYYNSMLINTVDEDGNNVDLGGEFPLEENEHFNNLLVNTQQSNIQVPTNVYNKDPNILNAIYNSEALNDVFISNFQKDPTLTWQYFGSSTGFFRIYPGEAKIKNAMKEAFKILNEARANGQGSMCNQAIMLITDGAMEDFESVFEEFNWPERYYTHISTLADVQENVMEYLHVLSRPMVINHDHDIIWTEAYMDTVLFATKAQSLLLMTSVAMPVFSKKKETLSHGILLGVVGSDIPLMEVMKLAPRYMLGAHGYAFLITNNGYILAHPDLRPLYKDGKKLKPKPNYNSVDLSEVEWEDTEETKRPLYLINDYFYTNIDETPFSFGMVLTKGHGSLMFMGNVSVEEGLHDLTSPDLSIASEWTYCETDIDPAHRKYSQLQAAIRYLLGKEPDLECDEVLLQQTLFDAVVTAPLEAYWNALMLNDRLEPGVETAFLGTRSGLMRIMRYAGVETRVAKRFLTPADKDNLFTIDHFPLWYRLAVENTPGSFYYYAVNDKGPSPSYVIATTAVTVSSEGKTAMAGGEFHCCNSKPSVCIHLICDSSHPVAHIDCAYCFSYFLFPLFVHIWSICSL